jgi:hypothetical protein
MYCSAATSFQIFWPTTPLFSKDSDPENNQLRVHSKNWQVIVSLVFSSIDDVIELKRSVNLFFSEQNLLFTE